MQADSSDIARSVLGAYAIHPAAALYPLPTDDDLTVLVEDIATNGLNNPVVIDANGTVLDGRSRLLACSIAGVAPTFEQHDGDPLMFVFSQNNKRRHMTKGAQAIIAVRAARECIDSIHSQDDIARISGVSKQRISHAATILDHAADIADQVVAGGSFDAAYQTAKQRKAAHDNAEELARRNLEAAERERMRAIEKLEKARQSIGPVVTIPPEPELALQFESATMPDPAPGLGDNLKQEQDFLRRLHKAKDEIEAISQLDPIDDSWFYEGHVMTVRSWASQVLASVHTMVERYNASLDQRREQPLRSVQ